jgi:hypothetical protein
MEPNQHGDMFSSVIHRNSFQSNDRSMSMIAGQSPKVIFEELPVVSEERISTKQSQKCSPRQSDKNPLMAAQNFISMQDAL